MPRPGFGKLRKHFPDEVLVEGLKFCNARKVVIESLDASTGTIEARVRTPWPDSEAVRITVGTENDRLSSLTISCECGSTVPCSHVAAVLIAMGGWEGVTEFAEEGARPKGMHHYSRVAQAERLFSPDVADFPPPYTITGLSDPIDALPTEIRAWQNRLATSHGLASNPAAESYAPRKKRIIFILARTGNDHSNELKLEFLKAYVRKDGSYGRLDPFDPYYGIYSPDAVAPEDSSIFRLLAGFGLRNGYLTTVISDEFTTQTLQRIVATGRCYFKDALRPPLKWGDPRKAAPAWAINDEFKLHTCLTADPPAAVFIGQPLIYLDVENNLIGFAQTDVPHAVALQWLSAPEIDPKYHVAVAEFAQGRSLPPPPPLPDAELITDIPRPRLRLFSAYSGQSDGLNAVVVSSQTHRHWAQVWFDYGPISVESMLKSATEIDRRIGEKRYKVRRDKKAEDARLTELKRTELAAIAAVSASFANAPSQPSQWVLFANRRNDWKGWIDEWIPKLESSGWVVEFDSSCVLRRVGVDDWFLDTSDSDHAGNDWFNIDLGIVVEGQRVSLLPVLRKIFSDAGYLSAVTQGKKTVTVILADRRGVEMPVERLEKIREMLTELFSINGDPGDSLRVDRLRAAEFAGVDGWRWTGSQRVCDLAKKLAEPKSLAVSPPERLNATLRPYQLEGLSWLQFLRESDLAGVLADDMGLGKTIQALAHLLTEKVAGRLDRPSLVVAPTSLMGNWRDETRRFAPDLRVLVLHGSERHEHFEKLSDFDLVVTSYTLLHRDREVLTRQPYHLVILDEAQTIKNPSTLFAQAARTLSTRHRVALTGTPMENHLGEFWAIFDFLMPGFLGNRRQFTKLFRDPIEKGNDQKRRQTLARRVAPLILRRRKSEVALELPPKNEMVQTIELAGAQRDLYESIRISMESRVREQIADLGLAKSHIVILDALLKLRQVCCDPRLLKIPSARKVHESAKLEWLAQTLPSMVEEGRKILLFSQFTSMLNLIELKLIELKIPLVRLIGKTRDRETPVQAFQKGKVPVFLISLKAGGTGLNLTAADTVIHYDPWWNPAVENQATDRAHRIGQNKTVFVYKLITLGTVEEKIRALQQRKAELVAALLDESGHTPLKIGEEELRALFAPLQ